MRSDIVPGLSSPTMSFPTTPRNAGCSPSGRLRGMRRSTTSRSTGSPVGRGGERPRGPGGRAALSERTGRRIDQSTRDTRRSENPGAVVSGALPRLESLAKAAGTHHHTERAGGRGARTLCGAALRMGAVGERERCLVRCAGGERPLKERFVSHRRRFGQGARCSGSTNLSAQ